MRRFLTLVCLLCVAIPAGISISGCTRNPAGNYCNGAGYGLKDTDVASIFLSPQTTGISIAFGQTQQVAVPTAKTCKGNAASVSSFTYGTTNNQLVDISPTGNICAGTWNRNTGGGIANYTICSFPNPLPNTGGLPYSSAYITATASSVTSNPVQVFVHPQVTSVSLAPSLNGSPLLGCISQTDTAQLDAQACFLGPNGKQQTLCAPAYIPPSGYACGNPGIAVPDCATPLGTLNYQLSTPALASINQDTNVITAELPGTTLITASVAGGESSAGYFSVCPPASISVTLANGATSGTLTEGVQQSLTTSVIDTLGHPLTGLTLDYQSTDPVDLTASTSGAILANFPGTASIFAICQPPTCNPAPINETGLYGTGLSVSSNPLNVVVPGTASDYIWVSSPGLSQYFVPIELLSGSSGASVRLPYVPNSMVMDKNGLNLYFGSSHELMAYSTSTNSLSRQDTNAPGVVLAVAPNDGTLVINDQVRQLFYIYNLTSTSSTTFGGMGTAAAWTPDSKTVYITDSASAGPGHSNMLYVYNINTGWTSYPLSSTGTQDVTALIPGVGAYISGNPTVVHTWCPSGTVGNAATMQFYPDGDPASGPVDALTNVLATTTDGKHVIGAALAGGAVTVSDIGVTIPTVTVDGAVTPAPCPVSSTGVLSPLIIQHTLNQLPVTRVNPTSLNQVVPSPSSALAFITYNGDTAGALLPYYVQGSNGAAGTVGYVTLSGGSAVTAPLTGAFSPDDTIFFVGTQGDNLVHLISLPGLTDSQQFAPNLPACTPVSAGGNDLGCTYTGSSPYVPATVITVKPRSTT